MTGAGAIKQVVRSRGSILASGRSRGPSRLTGLDGSPPNGCVRLGTDIPPPPSRRPLWRALFRPLRSKKDSMWQTARAAPVIVHSTSGGRPGRIVFSLDRLRPCSDQRPASRRKATSGCEGTGPWEPKQDSAPSHPSPERKLRVVVAAVGVRVAVAETTRRPCGPRFGLQVGRLGGLGCMRLATLCLRA